MENSFGKKRKFSKNEELYLTLQQEIEMNSVEVATPTLSVVRLSPQHGSTTQSEHLSHCSENNNEIAITNNCLLTRDANSRMKISDMHNYCYIANTLQEPLLHNQNLM